MHIPQVSPVASIVPVSGLDVTLHDVAGVNWHVLMPYTLFGAGLMTYSQFRLVRGQRVLSRQQATKSRGKRAVSKR